MRKKTPGKKKFVTQSFSCETAARFVLVKRHTGWFSTFLKADFKKSE
jgi:hypothetical protein